MNKIKGFIVKLLTRNDNTNNLFNRLLGRNKFIDVDEVIRHNNTIKHINSEIERLANKGILYYVY